ncbi:MAG: hypothetical protein IKY83_14570 [Proteobacteria bacterium]|nr:hypothetical protein [Pseudomonadota bacterium]
MTTIFKAHTLGLAAVIAVAMLLPPADTFAEISGSAARPGASSTVTIRPGRPSSSQAGSPSNHDDKDKDAHPAVSHRHPGSQGYRPPATAVRHPGQPGFRPTPGMRKPGHHAYVPRPGSRPSYTRPIPPRRRPYPGMWYDYYDDDVVIVPTVITTLPTWTNDDHEADIAYDAEPFMPETLPERAVVPAVPQAYPPSVTETSPAVVEDTIDARFARLFDSGCADNSREGFINYEMNPDIAGCSGAWTIPGIHHDEGPACGRQAGNSGLNPNGLGCNVEDLCAEGWHVCHGILDVSQHSPTGCSNIMENRAKPAFFVTRELSDGALTCRGDGYGRPAYANDLFGCGNLGCGLGPENGCGLLTRSSHDGCLGISSAYSCNCTESDAKISCSGSQGCSWCQTVDYYNFRDGTVYPEAWQCGKPGSSEAYNVIKISPELGGVICCRD